MNRVVLVLAIAGCGSKSPATQTAPPSTQAAQSVTAELSPGLSTQLIEQATCAIRDERVKQPLHLMVHGKRFAVVRDAREVEMRAAAVGASARVKTADFTLVGDLDLKRQRIRPREPLQGGWLGIRQASPGSVNDDTMTLDLKLPRNVVPEKAPYFRLACNALTFTEPPALPAEGKPVYLKPASKIAVRLEPSAKAQVVATIETPRIDPVTPGAREDPKRWIDMGSLFAHELARSGAFVKIRLGTTNTIEGWIAAAMLGPDQAVGGLLGSLDDTNRAKSTPVTCPHEVAIYVRDGDVIRVGTYRAGATILRIEGEDDEIEVDLGSPPRLPVEPVGSEPALEPWVRNIDLRGCS